MRLAADPDALEFAATIRDLLADVANPEALRVVGDDPYGRIPGVWKRLSDSGGRGRTSPGEYGGQQSRVTLSGGSRAWLVCHPAPSSTSMA